MGSEIHQGFIEKQLTACLFLDIQEAFDNVIPSILTSQLVELGLPPSCAGFSIS